MIQVRESSQVRGRQAAKRAHAGWARFTLPAAALLVFAAPAWAADEDALTTPQDFAYGTQAVTNGDFAAYRASLPLAVYQKLTRPDLGDLRVFNGSGEVVPYALERPRALSTTVRQAPLPLPLFTLRGDERKALDAIRVTIESGETRINIQAPVALSTGAGAQVEAPAAAEPAIASYVLDGRSLTAPIAALELSWAEDAPVFAGRLRVEASDDLGSWRTVADAAPVANLRAGEARLIEQRVEFPPTRSKFWRLAWAGEHAPFEITSVTVEPAVDLVEADRPTLTVPGVPVPGQQGELEFDLGARVPVDRVNLVLPEANSIVEARLFARAAVTDEWRPVTRGGFYRLRSGDADFANGAISVDVTAYRYWLARADVQGAGLGNGTPQLNVAWVPHTVLFLARGPGPYTLAYGSGSAQPATASLGSMPQSVSVGSATFAEPIALGGDSRLAAASGKPRAFPWKTASLWGVLAIGVILLALMAYRLTRELK